MGPGGIVSCHGDVGGYLDKQDLHRRLVHMNENQEFLNLKKEKLIESIAYQEKALEQNKFYSFKPSKLR